MTGVIIFVHVLACILLIAIILMQSGRGGGLTEAFSSAESLFGAHTSVFMVKATSTIAIVFFLTCMSLAVISANKDRSLMASKKAAEVEKKKASVDKQQKGKQVTTKPTGPEQNQQQIPKKQ